MHHNTRRIQNEVVYPPPSSPRQIVDVSQLNSDYGNNGLTVSHLSTVGRHKEAGQSEPSNPIKLRNKKDGSDSEFEVRAVQNGEKTKVSLH